MSVTQSCGPLSAATAAFCVIDETFEVEWLWSALQALISGAGASAQPQRQPVIAYAFDADPHTTARSRIRPARTPGRLCGVPVVDQLLVAEIEHDPDPAPGRGVGDRGHVLLGDQRAGRVAGRVDDDAAGARRDGGEDGLGAQREAVLRVRPHDHRRRVGELDLLDDASASPAACVITSSPGPKSAMRGVVERLLAAGGDDRLGGRVRRRRSRRGSARRPRASARRCRQLVVYLVKSASMAACAALATCSGVGKSGSPAPRSTTSTPRRCRRIASAATFIVGDTPIRLVRSREHAVRPSAASRASFFSRRRASTLSGTRP